MFVCVCVFVYACVFVCKRQTGLVPQAITVLKHLYLIALRERERGLEKERGKEVEREGGRGDGQIKRTDRGRDKRGKQRQREKKRGEGCRELKKL